MKRLLSNRKAVSPVIATVLMIMVTMAGMAILFGFVISYSDAYKAGVGSSVLESLTIEDVWFSPNTPNGLSYTSQVQISVYNAGKVDSKITSIYVNGMKLTETDQSDGNFNLKILVPMGSHTQPPITLYWPNHVWQSRTTYTFTVSTQTGSSFNMKWTAP